jgi:tetratricopeptide (TPR) repeat protein
MTTYVSPWNRLVSVVTGAAMISLSVWALPSHAQDPFRVNNTRPISAQTEAIFKTIFEQGNYPEANRLIQKVTVKDPLDAALKASISYLNNDLSTFKASATKTRELAETMVAQDPLRGNVYIAVGHFLEGASLYTQKGMLALPEALGKLQQVYRHLDKAEAIDAKDPEFSLVKGSVDLLVSSTLPFSDPQKAIQRLSENAGPRYLAYRGIAIAYRDISSNVGKSDAAKATEAANKGLEAVDKALQSTPTNPEVLYLKAQLLVKQQKYPEALTLFDQALAKKEQLPSPIVKSLNRERNKTANKLPASGQQPTAGGNSAPSATSVNPLPNPQPAAVPQGTAGHPSNTSTP